jgi:hypothetical protein
MVMVVPIDGHVDEAQDIAEEKGDVPPNALRLAS